LLAACKFLEQNAAKIIAPRKLGRAGLPFWLAGVESEIRRVPYGCVLVIAPFNYPLFLPGVQALQALCAGNAVVWKPGLGGRPVALLFAQALAKAGLPEGLLRITEESVEAGRTEIARRPDKIFFTGSSASGRAVLRAAAETTTPVVAELSGCDAVIALPSADPERLIAALSFGMRLNGSATCMAPRRLIAVGNAPWLTRLRDALAFVPAVPVPEPTRKHLLELVRDAETLGATIFGDPQAARLKPVLITNGTTRMRAAQEDIFAPLLTVIEAANEEEALAIEASCPYGLTVSIFGDQTEALLLAQRIDAGTILINDLIAPTADPRVPFAPRRASGFGATRGTEGLLEMTAIQTVLVRKGKSRRHYQSTTEDHAVLFDGIIEATHAATWRARWQGILKIVTAGKKLK
jgi:aldehyde dehydrogenase (NAD+)